MIRGELQVLEKRPHDRYCSVGARRATAVLLDAHRPLRICVTVPLMTPTTRAVMCHRVTTLSHTVRIPRAHAYRAIRAGCIVYTAGNHM